MQKDPQKRFASVAELRRALTRPQVWRRPVTFTAVLTMCLIVALAGAYFLWQSVRPVIPQVLSASPMVVVTDAPRNPTPAPPAAAPRLPVIAVVFDGTAGDAFAAA